MWIDTHCHLNFKDFSTDLQAVLEHAKAAQIQNLITISCEMSEIETVSTIANAYSEVYASAGIHPHEAKKDLEAYGNQKIYDTLKAYASLPKTVGLGETGLDYYYEHSPREEQKALFTTHLEVALETGLPLIVHTRNAESDTIDILKPYRGRLRGVIHCFTGTQWLAEQALELGFYISISGIATFKKAEALQATIKTIPVERLLLETDAPFLAPIPYRGKRNESAYLVHTAQMVANLKGISLEDLSFYTLQNSYTLFNKMNEPLTK